MGEAPTAGVVVVRAGEVRSGEGPVARTLIESPTLKVVLLELTPKRELPPHRPPSHLFLSILDGIGELLAGDAILSLSPGDVAVVPGGTVRGLRCREGRLVALAVVTPPPAPEDHRQEPGLTWPEPGQGPDPAEVIRQEHRGLMDGVASLVHLARTASGTDPSELGPALRAATHFLEHELLPHARAEERLIYPQVERVLRACGGATATMEYDHRRLQALTTELAGAISTAGADGAGEMLQQLATTVQLHFDKEEELYLPLLGRLGRDDREELVRSLIGGPSGAAESSGPAASDQQGTREMKNGRS